MKTINASTKGITTAALSVMMAVTATTALAEFPEKRIEIIVPWSAGGSTDARARILAPEFAKILGQTVVVRNVAGAAGTIGTAEVARGNADGYTLLATPSGPTVIQPQLRKLPYELDDFKLVCRIDLVPMVFMANKDSKYDSMDKYIEAARANEGKLSYSTAGVGTMPHLLGLGIEQGFGVSLKHLPTKGAADAMKNMLGGVVDGAPETLDHISRFDVKGLVVASDERLPEYPDMPTLKELGVDMTLANWQALYAPKDTPAEAITRLGTACKTALSDPEIVEKFENMNSLINVLTGDEADTFAHAQQQITYKLLLNAGLVKQ